jgi:tetratricopeptide (TPR) repeat protein
MDVTETLNFVEAARFCNAGGAYATTIDAVRLGLAADPRNPMLYVYRACAYDEFGRSAEAIADCEAALTLDPCGDAGVLALITLALVRERIGESEAAFAAARAAISHDPTGRESHAVLGTLLAWHGAYIAAWPELECHWIRERISFMQRFPATNEWAGEDIAGRRLLLVHGQGLGDMLQMLRYVPHLRERGATVELEYPEPMRDLVRTVSGVDAFVPNGTRASGEFDVYARLMSLPRLSGEDGLARIAAVPYLGIDAERRAAWECRLGARDERLRVGLVWAGNPAHENDRRRSIPLAAFAPLAAIPEMRWVSLQIGARANDAAPAGLALERFDDGITDLADTAALVSQLDLVIAADTGVAHLAGALGVPVWLALPWRPDWRWSPTAATSPWYPSMRLFHASDPSWALAIATLASELATLRRARG